MKGYERIAEKNETLDTVLEKGAYRMENSASVQRLCPFNIFKKWAIAKG